MTLPSTATYMQKQITGDGPLIPVILRLAGPVVAMMYLQNAYNIIDTIWVGQLLGKTALAGIGTGGYILWLVFGLCGLVSVGLTATVSRRIGEGNVEEAEKTATRGIYYTLAVSIVVGVALWLGLPAMFRMMATDAQVTHEGMMYMRVLLLGVPFIFLSISIQSVFQAAGDTVTPMWLMAGSLVINTFLDPLLMLGLWGFPKMGIAGAALATVLARGAWVGLGIYLLAAGRRIGQRETRLAFLGPLSRLLPAMKPGQLRLVPEKTRGWDWPGFGKILFIGAPHALSMALFPFVYMVLVRIPAQYGPHEIAALRIGHTVEGMSFFLALGFMIATSTCVGQNLGAGKPLRAASAAWTAAGIVTAILIFFSVCFRLFAQPISAVFSPDPQIIAAGAVYLGILAWSQAFMGIEIVLGGGFSGAGDTLPPMFVAVPFNLARIPVAYYLSATLGWGVLGVWWAISGSSIIKGVVLALWFMRGKWVKKNV